MTLNHEPAICLNGVTRALKDGETVTDLIIELTGSPIEADGRAADGRRLGVAVALNGAVISRSLWAQTVLTAGDDIEVVTAAQGG